MEYGVEDVLLVLLGDRTGREGGERGGERGEEVGALCACKTSSRLSRHEESTCLSTIVALCIWEIAYSALIKTKMDKTWIV